MTATNTSRAIEEAVHRLHGTSIDPANLELLGDDIIAAEVFDRDTVILVRDSGRGFIRVQGRSFDPAQWNAIYETTVQAPRDDPFGGDRSSTGAITGLNRIPGGLGSFELRVAARVLAIGASLIDVLNEEKA